MRGWWKRNLWGVNLYHRDSVECTLTPCDPTRETRKVFYVRNSWGRLVIDWWKEEPIPTALSPEQ